MAGLRRSSGCRHPVAVHAGFLTELGNVLLVANSLVPKPVGHLVRGSKVKTNHFEDNPVRVWLQRKYNINDWRRTPSYHDNSVLYYRYIFVCESDLRHSDGALLGQLLLGLLARVRVRQVGVKILVENIGRLLAEVPPLPPDMEKTFLTWTDGKQ